MGPRASAGPRGSRVVTVGNGATFRVYAGPPAVKHTPARDARPPAHTMADGIYCSSNQINLTRNTIPVQIVNHSFQALLDSGASSSVISANVVKKLKLPHRNLDPDEILNVVVADGRSIPVLGKTEVGVKVNGLAMPCEFLILPPTAYNLILGLDFLEANKVHVDFANRIVTFFNDLTALNLSAPRPDKMSNSVCTLHTTILPPFSETVVPILLPPRYSSEDSICEPLPMNKGQKFICARSAIDTSQFIAACKLLNPTNQVIWLPRHKALGILEPIHSQTLAVMTPSVTSHTDMNTTPTAQPLHSPETTSTHTNHTTQRPPSLDELGVIYQSDSLSAEENSRLKDLLQANVNVFSASISDLQSTPYIQHSIDTGNATPIRQRSYRHSPAAKAEINKQIEEMLQAKIIEPSSSMWASPVVLVKKKMYRSVFALITGS